MSTIVCPIDFQDASLYSVRIAAAIAEKTNAEILFLHAQNEPENQMRERLEAGMARVGFTMEKLSSRPFSFVDSRKGLIQSIKEIGQSKDIGLIIMITNGISDLKELYGGTHTENVAGKTPYPVLSVPHDFEGKDFKQILFATDYESSAMADTESLLLFAQVFGSKLHVIHISDEENPASQSLFESFKNGISSKFGAGTVDVRRLIGADKESLLLNEAVELDVDLIALHKNQFNVADGSKTDLFVRMAQFPVLILKS